MKSAVFLSIREKATRLPKKVLLEIKGKAVTEHLIDRLKLAKLPDLIVLCTSTHPGDTVLVNIARRNDVEYFRGSEDDKLNRYLKAALKFGVDFMVVVDGDDIFCDPIFIDETIETFTQTNADYITCKELPLGIACSGIKLEALNRVCEIKDEIDTEVWGGYFTETGLFKVEYLKVEDKELRHPEIRMTLDYPEDLEFFKAIFDRLYVPGKVFTLKEIMTLLKNNSYIVDINKDRQKAYIENLRKHTKIKLKNPKERKI